MRHCCSPLHSQNSLYIIVSIICTVMYTAVKLPVSEKNILPVGMIMLRTLNLNVITFHESTFCATEKRAPPSFDVSLEYVLLIPTGRSQICYLLIGRFASRRRVSTRFPGGVGGMGGSARIRRRHADT